MLESHLASLAGASGIGSNETNPVIETDQPISSLIFRSESDEFVAAFIRKDSSISPTKLRNAIRSNDLVPASEEELAELALSGAGIANHNRLTVIADESLRELSGALPNSIQVNYGAIAINPGRNYDPPMFTDIRSAAAGDPCAKCDHGVLRAKMGIEVGHVFKLGTRYSEPMGLTFSDQTGREKPVVMGCYGIGVSRIIAAVVEQNHDDNGIVWPRNIAPFTVVVIPTSPSHELRATLIYDELVKAGMDVILDDRDVNLGVKLNDADLIGYPYQAIVGNRGSELEAEVKDRRHGEGQLLHIREFRSYTNIPRL